MIEYVATGIALSLIFGGIVTLGLAWIVGKRKDSKDDDHSN